MGYRIDRADIWGRDRADIWDKHRVEIGRIYGK